MGDGKELARSDYWLQRLIAQGLVLGIGKKELLEDYYLDEFMAVLDEWALIHGYVDEVEQDVCHTPMAFFQGIKGEVV